MKNEEHNETVARTEKMKNILNHDGVVFKDSFEKTHNISQILEKYPEIQEIPQGPEESFVKIAGRIMSIRTHGKLAFVDLKDYSGKIQIAFKSDVLGDENFEYFTSTADMGDHLGIEGDCFFTQKGMLTVLVKKFVFLSKSLRPLPSGFYSINDVEKRYRQRYLDLIANDESMNIFKMRFKLVQEIRNYFLERDFVEITTRTLQPQAGGAMAKPFFTHHNALDHDFALRISPELDLKMSVIGGFERVFEFAIDFRNEGMDPSHLQEFQMLEWYCAYKNYKQGMEWTEDVLRRSITAVIGSPIFTIKDRKGDPCEIDMSKSFRVVTFADLLKEQGVDIFASKEDLMDKALECGITEEEAEARSRGNLIDDIYKKLIRPNLIQPTFITHYPSDLLPLARQNDEDPRLTDSYQVLMATWEIVKGYSELTNPVTQRKALEDQAGEKANGDEEAMQVDEEYLVAMEHGLPPVTGCGIGIDRLITVITGQSNLRDTVLFPLMKPDEGYDYI